MWDRSSPRYFGLETRQHLQCILRFLVCFVSPMRPRQFYETSPFDGDLKNTGVPSKCDHQENLCKESECPMIKTVQRPQESRTEATTFLSLLHDLPFQARLTYPERIYRASTHSPPRLCLDLFPAREAMDTLESLSAELGALTRTAEQRFRSQPRSTRNKLTAETRSIFRKYAEHGNQARLRHNVKAFLETGDEGMTFAETPRQRPSAHPAVALPHMQKASRISERREPEEGAGPAGESRTVDAESAQLVAAPPDGLDFHLDRSFVLDADTTVPEGLLESVDRVFGLYAKEAKLLLSHHCEKYGNEAVFRAGVREFVMR